MVATEEGFLPIAGKAEINPEAMVTIKNEFCHGDQSVIRLRYRNPKAVELTTTRKIVYRVISDKSRPVFCGMPSNLASCVRMTGRSKLSNASKIGGKTPEKRP